MGCYIITECRVREEVLLLASENCLVCKRITHPATH